MKIFPLLFTCKLNGVLYLRVVLPNGAQEAIGPGDSAADIVLPAGFTAESLSIKELDSNIRNYSLTLSIVTASLLDGGNILCDNTIWNVVMAGCPLLSIYKFEQLMRYHKVWYLVYMDCCGFCIIPIH